MPKIIRRIVACLVLAAMTFLFFGETDFALRYGGWLPEWQVVPAMLSLNLLALITLVLVTLLFGRVYCSVICPLGIYQDVVSWTSGIFRKKKRRFSYKKERKLLRWTVLGLFVLTLGSGLYSWAMLIDPYSAYGRMAVSLFAPLARVFIIEDTSAMGQSISWVVLGVAVGTFCAVTVCAWQGGRAYCNSVCPVGTVLGFFSRFALFRPMIDRSKCRHCGLCATQCKASCIDMKNGCVEMSRCVACMNCLSACRESALRLRPFWQDGLFGERKNGKRISPKEPNLSRRHFLCSSVRALGLTAVIAPMSAHAYGKGSLDSVKRHTAVVPAGARGVRDFFERCTGCQLCVANCPHGVLRPSDDWRTCLQPSLSYENGFCSPDCNICSQLCPTDAIRPVSVEEKPSIRIGYAVWEAERCLVLTEGRACGNCARHCPSGAIYMKSSDPKNPRSPRVPTMDAALCIGCGMCEYYCPAVPMRAMHVEGRPRHSLVGEPEEDEMFPPKA